MIQEIEVKAVPFVHIENVEDRTGIRFRSIDQSGFYSTAEHALESIKQDKGTPQQFKAMLLKNGAKQAELDWMDYDGSFTDKSVTKDEIQEWIGQNRIEIEEVTKSNVNTKLDAYKKSVIDRASSAGLGAYFDHEDSLMIEIPGEGGINSDEVEFKADREFAMEGYGISEEQALLIKNLYEEDRRMARSNTLVPDAKYSKYTLPGGKNYKELLLTMPVKKTFDKSKLEIKRHLSSATQGTTEIIYDGTSLGNFGDDPRYVDGELRQKIGFRMD